MKAKLLESEMNAFWKYFVEEQVPKLFFRAPTFRKAFEILDSLHRPVFIVETGSARTLEIGDGQSTFLFENYLTRGPGGVFLTVDVEEANTVFCSRHTDEKFTSCFTKDSVDFLRNLDQVIP